MEIGRAWPQQIAGLGRPVAQHILSQQQSMARRCGVDFAQAVYHKGQTSANEW
jgi:hypothetical protein